MRILHVITGLSVGGAEMTLYRLLSAMDRKRFDPAVISLTGDGPIGDRIRRLEVPVHTIDLRPGVSGFGAVGGFLRVLRTQRPDVIQGWQYHGSLMAQLGQLGLRDRPPVLWNIRHGIHAHRDEKRTTAALMKIGARLSRRAERVIYVAQASALQHEALGYPADKRMILPNGFDLDRFAPRDDARLSVRQELGVSPSTVLIGKIARYHPAKDHANFLTAASHLARSHPDVHFVLAGIRVDPTNAPLLRLVTSLNLEPRTHLLGQRDDTDRLFAALDIATSASSSEAFPNAVGEAMACGVPCVATDVGDSALLIGESGRLVPPRQPHALALAWHDLIDMGRDGRVALGLTARRRIAEQYGLRSVVARYEELYADLRDRWLARPTARRHDVPLARPNA